MGSNSEYVKAKEYFENELAISIANGDRNAEESHYKNLVIVHEFLGDYVKSEEFFQKALESRKTFGGGEEALYSEIGAVYLSLGRNLKAKEYLEKALAISIETGELKKQEEHYGRLGIVCESLSDYEKAKANHEKALAISVKTGNAKGQGAHYANLGIVYHSLSDYGNAERFHQKALAVSKQLGDRIGAGACCGNMATVYQSLGDHVKAEEYLKESLAISVEIGDRRREAANRGNLGVVYRSVGKYGKAKDFLEEALAISIEIGHRYGEGRYSGHLGSVCQCLGDFTRAIQLYEKALAIQVEVGDRRGEGTQYGNLGTLSHFVGQFVKAKEFYEKALEIEREIGDRANEAIHYCNLGGVHHSLGECRKAKEYLERALVIRVDIGDRRGVGETYARLANVHRTLKEYVIANEFLEKALEINTELGDRSGQSETYSCLGTVSRFLGQYLKAKEYHECALSICAELGDRRGEGVEYGNLGCVHHALGNLALAEEYYKKGLAICHDFGNVEGESTLYYQLACLYVVNDKEREGFFCLCEGVRRNEELRSFLGDHDHYKITFAENNRFFYNLLAFILWNSGNIEKALYVSELGRARALVDLLSLQYSMRTKWAETVLTDTQIEEIMQKETTSVVVYISFHNQTMLFWILRQNKKISCRFNARDDLKTTRVSDNISCQDWVESLAKKTQQQLREEEYEDRSLFTFYETDVPIRDQIKGNCLTDGPDEDNADGSEQELPLRALYKLIVSPVVDLLECSEIIFVPERSLYNVSFAALIGDDGKSLSEKFKLRVVPSLTILKFIQDSPADHHSQTGVLVVGDPDVGLRRICRLPAAMEEARMIGRLMGVEPLTGQEATKAVVLRRMRSVSLIHIAAHGHAKRGEIALAPVRPTRRIPLKDDFMLTMSDVSQVQLRAKLVVLSCCHSSRGHINAEGVVGIARAFLGSGARSVLVSLWPVEDQATKAFMRQFYAHLIRGQSASECLHEAMKWMRGNPQYCAVNKWAPFMLIGDSVSFNIEKCKFPA